MKELFGKYGIELKHYDKDTVSIIDNGTEHKCDAELLKILMDKVTVNSKNDVELIIKAYKALEEVLKPVYMAVVVHRSKTEIRIGDGKKRFFDSIEEVRKAVERHKSKNNNYWDAGNGILVEDEEEKGEHPWGIMGYKIYKRYATNWEVVEQMK